jgi:predicted nuclease of predicted toxin-antitoxin system
MRILIDMNLSPAWVGRLVVAGFEAAHWSTIGAANASDKEIMKHAKVEGYIVLTHDLDFSSILAATNGGKPSVIQVRSDDVSPDAIGEPVIRALHQMATELEAGALLSIDPVRVRIRLLPLRR